MSLLADAWHEFNDPLSDGWTRLGEHLRMSMIALAIAAVVGLLLGVACWKLGPVAAFVAIGLGNLGRTVPTFAVMALILALSSIGEWPAIAGLALLGLPPVLLNVYTGLQTNDPKTLEAATGVGFGPIRRLAQVELPLALPFTFAGLQSAGVQIVATATLAGAIGAGGLGSLITAGLNTNQNDVILAGAIPVVLLSLVVEAALVVATRFLTPTGLRVRRRSPRTKGITA